MKKKRTRIQEVTPQLNSLLGLLSGLASRSPSLEGAAGYIAIKLRILYGLEQSMTVLSSLYGRGNKFPYAELNVFPVDVIRFCERNHLIRIEYEVKAGTKTQVVYFNELGFLVLQSLSTRNNQFIELEPRKYCL